MTVSIAAKRSKSSKLVVNRFLPLATSAKTQPTANASADWSQPIPCGYLDG